MLKNNKWPNATDHTNMQQQKTHIFGHHCLRHILSFSFCLQYPCRSQYTNMLLVLLLLLHTALQIIHLVNLPKKNTYKCACIGTAYGVCDSWTCATRYNNHWATGLSESVWYWKWKVFRSVLPQKMHTVYYPPTNLFVELSALKSIDSLLECFKNQRAFQKQLTTATNFHKWKIANVCHFTCFIRYRFLVL